MEWTFLHLVPPVSRIYQNVDSGTRVPRNALLGRFSPLSPPVGVLDTGSWIAGFPCDELILPRSAVGLRICISNKFPVMLVLLVPGPSVTVRPPCVDSPHHT